MKQHDVLTSHVCEPQHLLGLKHGGGRLCSKGQHQELILLTCQLACNDAQAMPRREAWTSTLRHVAANASITIVPCSR